MIGTDGESVSGKCVPSVWPDDDDDDMCVRAKETNFIRNLFTTWRAAIIEIISQAIAYRSVSQNGDPLI